MNKLVVLGTAAALALAGAGTYALSKPADAQDAPAAASDRGGDWKSDQDHRGWGMERHHWMAHRMMAHRWIEAHAGWGLFYPVADKNLSVGDVQTIAQSILLRHGNHAWKVVDVAQNQDKTVSFAYATADGGVVARFAIDTQTGRIRRVG